MRDKRSDVGQLRLLGAQELLAGGNIEEQVANGDDGARRERRLVGSEHLAAGDFNARAGLLLAGAGFEGKARDRSDGRQGLAAEAESGDAQQVVRARELAGGVTLEGEHGVVMQHAAAVVGDADEAPSSACDLDAQMSRTGVDGVLEQLLDDRGRTLHDLSGRDFIRNIVGEDADAAHLRILTGRRGRTSPGQ